MAKHYGTPAQHALETARDMARDVDACADPAELATLFEEWRGAPIDAGPDADYLTLRDTLRDCIREFCAAAGVHCSRVPGLQETDTGRA